MPYAKTIFSIIIAFAVLNDCGLVWGQSQGSFQLEPSRETLREFSLREAVQNVDLFQRERGSEASSEALEFEEGNENSEEIETDRDSFTPSTATVQPGRFVFESAYSFIDNRNVDETHSFPELLLRYGLSENLELRLGWNYEIGGASSPVSGNATSVFDDEAGETEEASHLTYGMKLSLSEGSGLMPKSAFMLQGFTPTAGESNLTQLSATHVFGWELANGWVWDVATRYGTSGDSDDRFNTWSPSTVIKVPIGERWKAHAEYFGVFSDGQETESSQNFFSPGAHYLINENLEVGFRVGWGLNDQSPNSFSNFGFGWQY